MIRPALYKSVLEALSRHPYLRPEDFEIAEYVNKSDNPCVSIAFRYDPTLKLQFVVPKGTALRKAHDEYRSQYYFDGTAIPGRESYEESFTAVERRGLLAEIEEWVGRLYEDSLSSPLVRRLESHAAELAALRARLEEVPDEPLSKEDLSRFQAAIDGVRDELLQQLKAETADKDALKQRVDELGRDIEFLKQALRVMTRKQFAEVLISRIRKWQERVSIRQLTAGARALKGLLPPKAAAELDTVATVVDQLAAAVQAPPSPSKDEAGK